MGATYPFSNYRVFITPLVRQGVYGTTMDVTKDIDLTDMIKSFSNVKQEIDNGDYDIGIFTFGNMTLNCINTKRKFNNEDDALSIFPYTRDKAKVEIKYTDEGGVIRTRFKGLINEEATRASLRTDSVRFKVLSLDSIFRQIRVPSGSVVNGDPFSRAIKKIINIPSITDVITYNEANINVHLDLRIDAAEGFSDTIVKDSLDSLLRASNSVLYIDENENIIVSPRIENDFTHYLYGSGDIFGREDILSVNKLNTGVHRVFNSVKIGETEVSKDDAWIEDSGFRQKEYSFDFITDRTKELRIAGNILTQFRVPKMETEIVVKTGSVKDAKILDLVSVDYNYRMSPDHRDNVIPMYGVAKYGEAHYPVTSGSFRILPIVKWKIIGISENHKNFTTTLKLRQTGSETNDGHFSGSLFDFSKSSNSQNLQFL